MGTDGMVCNRPTRGLPPRDIADNKAFVYVFVVSLGDTSHLENRSTGAIGVKCAAPTI